MTQSLISKDLFLGLDDVAHLCTGGEAPFLRASRDALMRFTELKGRGMEGRSRIIAVYEEAKVGLAQFLSAPGGADDLAFLGHAADGINLIANGIEWKPGDEVVSIRREYPSSLLPWLARRDRGVALIAVEPGEGVEDRIEAAMTERTRIVCVSHISYLTGFRIDLARLSSIVRSRGAMLVVDASHALGAIPVPLDLCDAVVSCCYKFALGTHGVGVFYLNRRRLAELRQPSVGWFSIEWPGLDERSEGYALKPGAGRFELGNPSFISIFVLNEAVKILNEFGAQALEDHVLTLGGDIRDGLVHLGLDVWTPADPLKRGTNTVFGSPDADGIVERLGEAGVLAWSGDGRARFSIHGYNDSSDVDRALTTLAAVV